MTAPAPSPPPAWAASSPGGFADFVGGADPQIQTEAKAVLAAAARPLPVFEPRRAPPALNWLLILGLAGCAGFWAVVAAVMLGGWR